jgi:catechol 2,3-dioxygenase-like lactoylglutathione lyase family enzyme
MWGQRAEGAFLTRVIQHVSLECRRADEDAHRRFWRALGFADVEPPPGLRDRAGWLEAGPTQIHLLWSDDPVVPRAGHVAVWVEDLEVALAALDAEGFAHEPRREHWGAPRHYARAPGGHTVEVFDVTPTGGGSEPPSRPRRRQPRGR